MHDKIQQLSTSICTVFASVFWLSCGSRQRTSDNCFTVFSPCSVSPEITTPVVVRGGGQDSDALCHVVRCLINRRAGMGITGALMNISIEPFDLR
jgi:hypothetical protein